MGVTKTRVERWKEVARCNSQTDQQSLPPLLESLILIHVSAISPNTLFQFCTGSYHDTMASGQLHRPEHVLPFHRRPYLQKLTIHCPCTE